METEERGKDRKRTGDDGKGKERKRGSAQAFSRLVKFYSINVFENLRFHPSGNEIGPYDKNVHSGNHFRKSAFSVPGRKAKKRKKIFFSKI